MIRSRGVQAAAVIILLLLCREAISVQINPNEYFAYSPPSYGGATFLLSRKACPVAVKGLSAKLRKEYDVPTDAVASGQWKDAGTWSSRDGSWGGCWTDVSAKGTAFVLWCSVRDNRKALELSSNCYTFREADFRDTRDLPQAPRQANFR